MEWKICLSDDIPQLSELNGQLHEDEGATPMSPEEREDRLRRWLGSEFVGVLFSEENETVGYALYRPADPDSEGMNPGVFIRQFFVVRHARRKGFGRQMFQLLKDEVWSENSSVLLDTEYENTRAQAFWRSVGFSEYQVRFILRHSS